MQLTQEYLVVSAQYCFKCLNKKVWIRYSTLFGVSLNWLYNSFD